MSFKYRFGPRVPIEAKLDADTLAIVVGDAITIDGYTDGYAGIVDGSGETILGIAMQDVASPAADGDLSVLIDVSELSVYEAPPDAGSVTQAKVGNMGDVGADGKSVNIDATVVDNIRILSVDTNANTMLCQIVAGRTGV